MKYKVLLVSSGQPSLNPRLVKEADTLACNGYDVTVIYAYWNAWGTKLDIDLIAGKKWKAIRAGGDPVVNPFIYFLSRLLFKASYWLVRLTNTTLLARLAISRSCLFLEYEAAKHQADIYIGHNLGALSAVVKAGKKYGKPCGFDAEDFHRNEVIDDVNNLDARLKTIVEDKYIPQLQYLSVSSPLIGELYKKLYPAVKQLILLNTFPKINFKPFTQTPGNALKLFWFSQTVGFNRGIEQITEVLQYLKEEKFELHLLGDADNNTREFFAGKLIGTNSTIHFYPPIPPDNLFSFAAKFDIGVASENNKPLNRDICLTNKIFTYLQVGLPVLASDTQAQTQFMQRYRVAGKIYQNNNLASLTDALVYYKNNIDALKNDRQHNYQLGQSVINWDTEAKKFLSLIEQTISA